MTPRGHTRNTVIIIAAGLLLLLAGAWWGLAAPGGAPYTTSDAPQSFTKELRYQSAADLLRKSRKSLTFAYHAGGGIYIVVPSQSLRVDRRNSSLIDAVIDPVRKNPRTLTQTRVVKATKLAGLSIVDLTEAAWYRREDALETLCEGFFSGDDPICALPPAERENALQVRLRHLFHNIAFVHLRDGDAAAMLLQGGHPVFYKDVAYKSFLIDGRMEESITIGHHIFKPAPCDGCYGD